MKVKARCFWTIKAGDLYWKIAAGNLDEAISIMREWRPTLEITSIVKSEEVILIDKDSL